MAVVSFTALSVINASAALLNDPNKSVYTFAVQLPYLNIAMQELQEIFELNNIPVTDTFTSSAILMVAGSTSVGFSAGSPTLPADLIEPKVVWQRQQGIDPYVPMTKVDFLPRYIQGIEINQFINYTWQSQELRFLASNTNIELVIDYVRKLFIPVVLDTDLILILNTQTFLEYRTASLCAQFIMENPSRAQNLDNDAGLALNRSLGIGTKGRQRILIRRRPFRAAYKRRSFM
jgi:hypothetical protein